MSGIRAERPFLGATGASARQAAMMRSATQAKTTFAGRSDPQCVRVFSLGSRSYAGSFDHSHRRVVHAFDFFRLYLNSAAALISVCVNPHVSGTSTNVHESITRPLLLFSAGELALDAALENRTSSATGTLQLRGGRRHHARHRAINVVVLRVDRLHHQIADQADY